MSLPELGPPFDVNNANGSLLWRRDPGIHLRPTRARLGIFTARFQALVDQIFLFLAQRQGFWRIGAWALGILRVSRTNVSFRH
jgi:hypothetical protein